MTNNEVTGIDQSAKVHPSATIGNNVNIHADAKISENVVLRNNVVVGANVIIGPGTIVGEGSQLYPGTHIGQNCKIGKHVKLIGAQLGERLGTRENTRIAGFVTVDDYATISDSGVHQFCRIGEGAMVGGGTFVRKDVAPYLAVTGENRREVKVNFLNKLAADKAGLNYSERQEISEAYKTLFFSKMNVSEALAVLKKTYVRGFPELEKIIEFVEKSHRGIYIKRRILSEKREDGSDRGESYLKWLEPAKLHTRFDMYQSQQSK